MKKILILLLTMLMITTTIMPIITAKSNIETSQIINQKNSLRDTSLFTKINRGPILDKIVEFLKNIPFVNKTINFIKNLFGLVEDNSGDPEQDTYYEPYVQFSGNDPISSKPTDNSISVTIEDFDIIYTTKDDTFEFDIFFNGKTTGDVYACYWVMVAYFDDGTNTYYNFWNGPRNQQDLEIYDNTFELTFYGTGPGGFTDWSTFKGRQYVTGDIGEQDDMVFEIPENDDYDKYPTDFLLYVRAFSDKELTQWNQDSISLFDEVSGSMYAEAIKGQEKEKGVPGFEIIAIITAMGISLILMRKKRN